MFLALFPLQLALFPTEEIPLHIFEPRYRQLIAECRDEDITFGIPTVLDGRLSRYGTEVELVRITKTYDSGEMDIIVRGLRVFELQDYQEVVPEKLYSGAKVKYPEDDPKYNEETRDELLRSFRIFLALAKRDLVLPEQLPEDLSFFCAPYAVLSLDQRLTLLAMRKESKRQTFLLKHLEELVESIREKNKGPVQIGQSTKDKWTRVSLN